jgi:hypothetical protein
VVPRPGTIRNQWVGAGSESGSPGGAHTKGVPPGNHWPAEWFPDPGTIPLAEAGEVTDRHVIWAQPSTGKQRGRRTVRVVRYAGGWDVYLGLGGADPARRARATVRLQPEEARALAETLAQTAAAAEAARAGANDEGEA